MKHIITYVLVLVAVSAEASMVDPSGITSWDEKVKAYQEGIRRVKGPIKTPARKHRTPSSQAVNGFMSEWTARYSSAKTEEMTSAFPGLAAADYETWKKMTAAQKRSFATRYKAAWLEAYIGTTPANYVAWKKMTPEDRTAWESQWTKEHRGCTSFSVPELIETSQGVTDPSHIDMETLL